MLPIPHLRLAAQGELMQPVVIIGGGLAGAGAAIGLARAGRQVVVLEREAGAHDKVCGEFLSYEAVDSLRRLGVDPLALGAVRVDQLAVCVGPRRVVTALPFNALSLSRRVLDDALLQRAAAEGAVVRRGARVTRLDPLAAGWRAAFGNHETVEADQVLLATGKHDLRGWRRPAGWQGDLIGFKLHLPAEASSLRGEVSVHLFPGGYAGLELVEGERANLCLLVRRAQFAACGGDWPSLVRHIAGHCPHLAPVLEGARAGALKPLAVSAIPYGHVQSRAEAGLWRLGDQAAVIPSFAGEGMAIALHSAELAASHLLAGRDSRTYQRVLAGNVRAQVAGATLLSQALVRRAGQGVAGAALTAAPRLAQAVARLTRLPPRAVGPAFTAPARQA